MTPAAPHLYQALRGFCLAAFAALGPDAGPDGEIPFVLDDHDGLYEYRPLLRDHVESRVARLAGLVDARIALDELRREPAAAVFARGAADGPAADRALFGAILVPLLVSTAEACGGFDWEDGAFNRVYGELEHALFGAGRRYAASAPLLGLSVGGRIELARGIRVERVDGADPDENGSLAFERELPAGELSLPDAPGELADAITALRLATGAPVAAGPLVAERLDRHPLEPRPLLGIAATRPSGEPSRLDPWRGKLAADVLARLPGSEQDVEVGEALERWELSLFEAEPLRSERLREALAALLGGSDGLWAAAMRAAVLVGEVTDPAARARVDGLLGLARGDGAGAEAADTVRRIFVETVLADDRSRLLQVLDEALLGLRARPAGFFSARASAA
jgi:hypothetical protein